MCEYLFPDWHSCFNTFRVLAQCGFRFEVRRFLHVLFKKSKLSQVVDTQGVIAISERRWLIVPGEVFYGKCLIGFDLEVRNTYSTIVWKLREHSKKLNPNYSNPGVTQSNHLESPVFLVQSRKPKNIKWPLPSNRRTDQRTERPSCPQGSAVIRCKGQLPNAVPRHTIRLTPRTSCACGHLVRDGWWKIINCIPQRDVVTKSINHPANGQQTLNPRPASRPRS